MAYGIILTYFIIGIVTLSHYGVNWDEVNHLTRGQAYIYYFLTRREHYDPKLFESPRHSLYQITGYDFAYQKAKDGDHPVFSDNVSALFNYIFFQKLGWMSDMDSSHIYGPFIVTVFLFFLYFWVEKIYGPFAAFVSVISLVLYPLFYGESHFNVQKDIPEAVYYGLSIMSFYYGYCRRSAGWIFLSAIMFGFAFGTKLNILFMPLTIALWLLLKEGTHIFRRFWSLPNDVRFSLFLYPIIGFGIFYFSWPHLWFDPVKNILQVFTYYKNSGILSEPSMPGSYYLYGFNMYAVRWILYTTPIITLFLGSVGIVTTLVKGWREKNKTSFLILLWFFIPIFRVSIPSSSIYGGVRQIMEYVPAIAILAGIGTSSIVSLFVRYLITWFTIPKRKQANAILLLQGVVILSFLPITLKMISMHPNESVYFNPIIGGLKGAKEKNIPGWGNALGNPYRQGINWINLHAEKNAKVALVYELLSNVPNVLFRSDIHYSNTLRSGPNRSGEYVMGLTNYNTYDSYYHRKYLERFLTPVYTVTVDGVDLLKIWKNDESHVKISPITERKLENLPYKKIGRGLVISFPSVLKLLRTQIQYVNENCILPTDAYYRITSGYKSEKIPGTLLYFPDFHWFEENPEQGKLAYLFAGDEVTQLSVMGNDTDSCLFRHPVTISAWVVE